MIETTPYPQHTGSSSDTMQHACPLSYITAGMTFLYLMHAVSDSNLICDLEDLSKQNEYLPPRFRRLQFCDINCGQTPTAYDFTPDQSLRKDPITPGSQGQKAANGTWVHHSGEELVEKNPLPEAWRVFALLFEPVLGT